MRVYATVRDMSVYEYNILYRSSDANTRFLSRNPNIYLGNSVLITSGNTFSRYTKDNIG